MHSYISLSFVDLSIAALLLLVITSLSMVLSIGIGRMVLIAATRLVLQLLLVGFVLLKIFALHSIWFSLLIIALMMVAASREIIARLEPGFQWHWSLGISGSVTGIVTISISLLALNTALRPDPWYEAKYLIPLTGMILGNVMSSASLSLKGLLDAIQRDRLVIESRLAMGHSRKMVFTPFVRHAVTMGIMPLINQMSAAGIITLPGTMSGQILAGINPLEAAKYQILLLLLISGAGILAAIGVSFLAVLRLTDHRERLRLDRLSA
ncbi:ABC transporter permease [Commensalibacter oyaizuii]|uniref:ABC transporter permease n=1 Tax=Commensalibacter oyaizuii TaxID=3043873 RepID=A0ABT6PY66_9PROT|nr:ABC transporter permease [Commensalibacter sp. TBRC 16381]MDI2089807.1 ABC transporter permease [Commensalibacter sp. TBRC 16381]